MREIPCRVYGSWRIPSGSICIITAYTVLKQEGYVKVDRRKGAVIALDVDRMRAVDELRKELQVILAKSSCKNISRQEVHELIDEIYEEYGGLN